MRTLVIGDIHGNFNALEQVLARANFDAENDTLIGLGDYTDGWIDSYKVVEYLRKLKHFIGIIGNHDY